MEQNNKENEFLHIPIEEIDPKSLYTSENAIFEKGLEKIDLNKPILFGRDKDGCKFVVDGNHHAYKAFIENQKIQGRQVATAKFLIKNNSDFRLIKELKVI